MGEKNDSSSRFEIISDIIPDCLVGFSFGTGRTNEGLAYMAANFSKIYNDENLPKFMQQEIAVFVQDRYNQKCDYVSSSQGRKYLSTRGVLEQFIPIWIKRNYKVVGLIAQSDHAYRCRGLLEEAGFIVVEVFRKMEPKFVLSEDDNNNNNNNNNSNNDHEINDNDIKIEEKKYLINWEDFGCDEFGYDTSKLSNNQFWTRNRKIFLAWDGVASALNNFFPADITARYAPFYPRSRYRARTITEEEQEKDNRDDTNK